MKPNSIFRGVDAADPDPQVIAEAVRVLRGGGLVVFPTSGLYGLGADALNPKAVQRVYQAKKRPSAKPILVLIGDLSQLKMLCNGVTETAARLMGLFWPGRLTVVVAARPDLPDVLTGGSGKIGVRLSRHPVARALVAAFGGPVTATSANISGQKGCAAAADLDPALIAAVDLVLDAGELMGGKGSTVVDASADRAVVLREGAISRQRLAMAGFDVGN